MTIVIKSKGHRHGEWGCRGGGENSRIELEDHDSIFVSAIELTHGHV